MIRTLILLWLAGASLRMTILALPPVLPQVVQDLGLVGTDIGVLTALPALLFALAAIPGARLIACLGALRTLMTGLLLTALGAAARGFAEGALGLEAATFMMCLGVAVMQPALPPLVRAWAPDSIGFATAVYTNGLLISEVVATAWIPELRLPLVGGDWRASLAFWALPVLATALLVSALGRRPASAPHRAPARWWPDWRDVRIWRLGAILGSVNASYFGLNGFLPGWLSANGAKDLVQPTLIALNVAQIPASVALLFCAERVVRRPIVYALAASAILAGIAGVVAMPGPAALAWAALAGTALGGLLSMALALPSLIGAVEDVPRLSAAMFTVSYGLAMLSALLGGWLWTATGNASAAFLPAGILASFATVLGFTLKGSELSGGERRSSAPENEPRRAGPSRTERSPALVLMAIAFVLGTFVLAAPVARADGGPRNFFVGGRYEATAEGRLMLGQMYVERHAPSGAARPVPIVLVHGSGQTGAGFVATPDGRPGWAENFADHGWTVFVVDQVGRGRSALFADLQGPLTRFTVEQSERMFTAPSRFMLWPQAALHTQWPGTGKPGDASFDAFYAAQVEGIADLARVEELNVAALITLLERIGPAVLLTHSQSGPYGWVVADRRPDLVRALVAVEPNGPPFMEGDWVGAPDWYRESGAVAFPWGIAHLPLHFEPAASSAAELGRVRQAQPNDPGTIACWDQPGPARRLPRLAGIPTVVVTSEASFRAGIDHCTVRFLNEASVAAQHLRLADHGIRGNGHMMMLEGNSAEVAGAILSWLTANVR